MMIVIMAIFNLFALSLSLSLEFTIELFGSTPNICSHRIASHLGRGVVVIVIIVIRGVVIVVIAIAIAITTVVQMYCYVRRFA